jgi:alpha-galactosidase
MELAVDRVEVRGDVDARARVTGDGPVALGPIEIDIGALDDRGWVWQVANRGDQPISLDAAAIVWRADSVVAPVRMLRHGYQSWSPTSVATFGVDADPSRTDGAHWLAIGMHHADPEGAWPGELRSELVTAIQDANGDLLVAGFLGGWEHDGTFRLRPADDGTGTIELWDEAYLGGAVLEPGESRPLHAVMMRTGEDDPSSSLAEWAAAAGAAGGARVEAPFQVGWCSWYRYFAQVSEADVRQNLGQAADWAFSVFQIDDGYQRAIGDWLVTNERFPASLDRLAADIAAAGVRPGIWLAPFVAAPTSDVATQHAGYLASHGPGRPLVGMVNDAWGGSVHVLDTTRPEVLAHLEQVARSLVASGYTYLKLDFTYAPGLAGRFADRSRTPAQRVRAGFDAIRRGAGDDTFLLGCGAPLGAAIGVVDGMRIGPDVAPWWAVPARTWQPAGYEDGAPSTLNAWRNTLARAFQHRQLWLNDPDCVMLRTDHTELPPDAARAWALAVGVSGGMALVSDDLSTLGPPARSLFDEVLELGRAADAAARGDGGHPPRCPDLLVSSTPTRLQSGQVELVGDPAAATAVVQGRIA